MPPQPKTEGSGGSAPDPLSFWLGGQRPPPKRSSAAFDRGGQTGPPRSNAFFSALHADDTGAADDRPAGRPPSRLAGRPAERPGAISAASARMARRVGLLCTPLYPLGSSSARGLVRSAGLTFLGSKIALFSIFSIFFRFFGLPNNALKFASKK